MRSIRFTRKAYRGGNYLWSLQQRQPHTDSAKPELRHLLKPVLPLAYARVSVWWSVRLSRASIAKKAGALCQAPQKCLAQLDA